MAAQSGIQVSTELGERLASLRKAAQSSLPRAIKVQIVNDGTQLAETGASAAKGSLASDFRPAVDALVDDDAACYVLVREDGATAKYQVIMWIPEGRLPIKERMMYASTQDTLKKALDYAYITDELRFCERDDIAPRAADDGVDASSELEKKLKAAREAEDQARVEMAQQNRHSAPAGRTFGGVGPSGGGARGGVAARWQPNGGGGGASSPAASRQPYAGVGGKGDTAVGAAKSNIGGYHSVQVPWADDACAALNQFKSGGVAWVQLVIERNPDTVVLGETRPSVAETQLASAILGNEPRYYLYKKAAGRAVLIYCCPMASVAHSRMVYSTAKQGILSKCRAAGIDVADSVEIDDPADVVDKLRPAPASRSFASSTASSSSTPSWATGGFFGGGARSFGGGGGGGGGNASYRHSSPASQVNSNTAKNTVSQAHPVYSLLGGQGPSGPRKKIVIPPRHAYG